MNDQACLCTRVCCHLQHPLSLARKDVALLELPGADTYSHCAGNGEQHRSPQLSADVLEVIAESRVLRHFRSLVIKSHLLLQFLTAPINIVIFFFGISLKKKKLLRAE